MIFKFFLILIFYNINIVQNSILDSSKDCLVHNLEYSYEYLYSSNDYDSKNANRNVYAYPLSKINDFQTITWKFIPIEEVEKKFKSFIPKNRSYYFIKSGKYENEYLCGFNLYNKISPARYLVKIIKINHAGLILYFNCFWNIESINTNQILPKQFIYRIENMFYKGPMYASSFIFNVGWYKRSIFVWGREENSQSKKSKWIIDCTSGEFMYSK